MNILVIMTCFNRKEKTKECITLLTTGNPKISFTFVVTDDNSNDGTVNMLEELKESNNIHIVHGDGNMFYSGGMREGMEYALEKLECSYDYLLMVNDDVIFFDKCVEKMVSESKSKSTSVVIGATRNDFGVLSYGAIKYLKRDSIKYRKVDISETAVECDTFNANCVLIPYKVFKDVGSIDKYYIHALGDFDYGLSLKKYGCKLYVSSEYVGICNNNSIENTWQDKNLSRLARLKLKEDPKGAPFRQWFHFLYKNFGLCTAIIRSLTPYIKIILCI